MPDARRGSIKKRAPDLRLGDICWPIVHIPTRLRELTGVLSDYSRQPPLVGRHCTGPLRSVGHAELREVVGVDERWRRAGPVTTPLQ